MSDLQALGVQTTLFETTVWRMSASSAPCDDGFDLDACLKQKVSFARVLAEVPDETLARAVQVGFHARPAFVELFVNRYQRLMTLWAIRGGLQHHDAEDLAAEVLTDFLDGGLAAYDSARDFEPYLRRAVSNKRVSWARRKRPGRYSDSYDPSGPDLTALDLLGRELERRLSEALPCLEPVERAVIEMTIRGSTKEEILSALADSLVPDLDRQTLDAMLAELPDGYGNSSRPVLVSTYGAGPVEQLACGFRKVYGLRFQARRKLEQMLAHRAGSD